MPDESVDAFLGKVVAGDEALSAEAITVANGVRTKAVEKMDKNKFMGITKATDFLSLECENAGKVRGMDLMKGPYLDEIREGHPDTELCISVRTSDENDNDLLERYFFTPDGSVTMQILPDEPRMIKEMSHGGREIIPEKQGDDSKHKTSYPDEATLRTLLSNLSSARLPRSIRNP